MGLARYLRLIKTSILEGGPGFAQIALTSECNANCGFCNFARDKKAGRSSVPIERLLRAVDILHDKGIRYIVFTGGEPLLHRGLDKAVARARGRGIEPVVCTNGSLLGEERLRSLHGSGLRNVIISVDSPDGAKNDRNRGLPGLTARIKAANDFMHKLGMHPTASVTISRLVGDFGCLLGFLRDMGFGDVTFSYPLNELHSTYLSFSDSELVDFSGIELIGIFEAIKMLKKEFNILNPTEGIDEMLRAIKGEPARFPCLAGYKYFFLDWNLDVYRCHYVKDRICAVEDFMDAGPVRDGCSRCMIDCYRDPSVLQHFVVSLSDSIQDLKHRRIRDAGRKVFNRTNYYSLKAVAEQFALVRRYGSVGH